MDKDDNQGNGDKNRSDFTEVSGRDDVEQRAQKQAYDYQPQDIRDLSPAEKLRKRLGQEIHKADGDNEDRNAHET